MSTFGRTGQGIGVNPYTGQPYSSSGTPGTNDWIKNNPNLETYYKMGIIPYGVPPDSNIAIEAVNNFHEKQRRKEQRGRRREFQSLVKGPYCTGNGGKHWWRTESWWNGYEHDPTSGRQV